MLSTSIHKRKRQPFPRLLSFLFIRTVARIHFRAGREVMTLTKKVGALLLLLTAGALIGIATFTFFFTSTVVDGLYVIAAQYEQLTLAQLQIQTLRVRNGQEDARVLQGRLIDSFDMI